MDNLSEVQPSMKKGDAMNKSSYERGDMIVAIHNPKFAQKTITTRKRFITPPPCIYLLGEGWKRKREQMSRNGESKQGTHLCASIGIIDSKQDTLQLDFNGRNYCAAKKLFIRGSDKRSQFTLLVKMFCKNGEDLGVFQSKNISEISNTWYATPSVKYADPWIASGSIVALFIRLRCRTENTKYLHVENGIFCGNSEEWGTFTIYLLDDNEPESEEFPVRDGYIHYGSTVKLVCTVTGMALPRLIIRKWKKGRVFPGIDYRVSQLHQCAFYVKDTERMYLRSSRERIVQFQAISSPEEPSLEHIAEGACWRIVGIDKAEYTFSEDMGPVWSPVTPVPIVNSLNLNVVDDVSMMQVSGENFTRNLRVRFGEVEAETVYKCEKTISCVVPDISSFGEGWQVERQPTQVPLSLVRSDGIIYATDYYISFHS